MHDRGNTPFHERNDAELMTFDDVVEVLRVPVGTLRWWRQEGKGPEFFTMGKRLYTTVGDVRRFIRIQRLAARPALPRPEAM